MARTLKTMAGLTLGTLAVLSATQALASGNMASTGEYGPPAVAQPISAQPVAQQISAYQYTAPKLQCVTLSSPNFNRVGKSTVIAFNYRWCKKNDANSCSARTLGQMDYIGHALTIVTRCFTSKHKLRFEMQAKLSGEGYPVRRAALTPKVFNPQNGLIPGIGCLRKKGVAHFRKRGAKLIVRKSTFPGVKLPPCKFTQPTS
ncbi:MAG: hypothetical protein AAFR04_09445 [Pseudomonadota bacterium]